MILDILPFLRPEWEEEQVQSLLSETKALTKNTPLNSQTGIDTQS